MEKEHVPDRKGLAYFFWALEMKYNLSTGLYCLEPWERKLFNTCLILILTMSFYTMTIFMPGYISSCLFLGCRSLDFISSTLANVTVSPYLAPVC